MKVAVFASALLAPTGAYVAPTALPRSAVLPISTLQAPLRPLRVAKPHSQAVVRSRPIVASTATAAQPSLVKRAMMLFASALAFVLSSARFAFAAERTMRRAAPGFAISGDVLKYGFVGGCVALSYFFKKEEKPIFIETPGAVTLDPETLKAPEAAAEQPPAPTEPTAPSDEPEDFSDMLSDDSAVFGSLAARMQSLADEANAPPADEPPPPADSSDGWGTGNQAVLEPPRDDEPRGVLDGEPSVEFPPGYPIVDGEVVDNTPTSASADQLAMLNRMMGME